MNSELNTKKNTADLSKDLQAVFKIILNKKIILFFMLLSLICLNFLINLTPPNDFNRGTIIELKEGTSIKEAAEILHSNNIIKSKTLFNLVIQFSEQKNIKAGEYLFDEPLELTKVAERIINNISGIPIQNITITEGMTVREIAERFDSRFENFNKENFIEVAQKYEGYLFPDTYRFSVRVDELSVIEAMKNNFNEKMLSIREQIEASEKTLDEVIIMASIVEKEATRDTIQEVTDVLWKRIEEEMPLQVDATFVYSIGKNSFTVTRDEMRDKEDPYNTYVHLGLPPTPISNPGLETILASINHRPTEYFFFLTGRDGRMYFAVDFEGHKRNRYLYLD